ncbi:zinc ribbon domain-containing protein [Paenibacillus lemnae]|uniref:Zinc ribbon domain-containing protein n=1 Tax=Paenibacillus lemnae TaxID=1330551 RepID=A0A848MES4_PAELE|nr:zinc ribbon domain-containing protein [Paenibacillus lemnae]NMO97904.1 zinc ribbon domain-containing protein [Paenibacillus lemnae]
MICSICGHENVSGKFCEKCGNRLVAEPEKDTTPEAEEAAASAERVESVESPEHTAAGTADNARHDQEASAGQTYYSPPASVNTKTVHTSASEPGTGPSQTNAYLESAKKNSKMYFQYFVNVLKNPLAAAQRTGSEQLINGIITMVIFALLIPLMTYLSLGEARDYLDRYGSPFVDVVLKPWLWLMLLLGLTAVYTTGAVKLATNTKVDIKEIFARFGTLLVPFIAIVIVGFLLAFMEIGLGGNLLAIGVIGAFFTIPVLIAVDYKRVPGAKLDTLYAILLIYAALLVTVMIIGRSLLSMMNLPFGL